MTKQEYLNKLAASLIDEEESYIDIKEDRNLLMLIAVEVWERIRSRYTYLNKNQASIDFFNSLVFKPDYGDTVWIYPDTDIPSHDFDDYFLIWESIDTEYYTTKFLFAFSSISNEISCDIYLPDQFYDDED